MRNGLWPTDAECHLGGGWEQTEEGTRGGTCVRRALGLSLPAVLRSWRSATPVGHGQPTRPCCAVTPRAWHAVLPDNTAHRGREAPAPGTAVTARASRQPHFLWKLGKSGPRVLQFYTVPSPPSPSSPPRSHFCPLSSVCVFHEHFLSGSRKTESKLAARGLSLGEKELFPGLRPHPARLLRPEGLMRHQDGQQAAAGAGEPLLAFTPSSGHRERCRACGKGQCPFSSPL